MENKEKDTFLKNGTFSEERVATITSSEQKPSEN